MVRIEAEEKRFSIDISDDYGRALADLVIGTLWLYAASSEETRGSLMSISRMVKGDSPLVDMELLTNSSVEGEDA
jgi:hypothetical protein